MHTRDEPEEEPIQNTVILMIDPAQPDRVVVVVLVQSDLRDRLL